MTNDEAARLMHAYVDGELDGARAAALEAHMDANPAARAACDRLREMSSALRQQADYHRAPASVAANLRAALPGAPAHAVREPLRNRWPVQLAALAGVALVTWAATIGYLSPRDGDSLAAEVLAGHVRATLGRQAIEVASSDQHTVKPWLGARLAYSPPVIDLSAQGFRLQGARLDHVGGRAVAALVYGRRHHAIDVYIWPARGDAQERRLTRDGFNLQAFTAAGMEFWLLSDLNRNELGDFARLLAQQAAAQ